MQLTLSKRNLSLLGYQCLVKHPDLAEELITPLIEANQSGNIQTDLIPFYYESYREHEQLKEYKLRPDKLLEFTGLIFKIYHPHIFETKTEFFQPRKGLVINLASAMHISKGYASKLLKEARVHVRVYDEFRNNIERLYKEIAP